MSKMTPEFGYYLKNGLMQGKINFEILSKKRWYVSIHNARGKELSRQRVKVSYNDKRVLELDAENNIFLTNRRCKIYSYKIWMGKKLASYHTCDYPYTGMDKFHMQWMAGFLKIDLD